MGTKKIPLAQLWQMSATEHISLSILREYKQYIDDKAYFPNQHALFRLMTIPQWNPEKKGWDEPRYSVTIGAYNHWFDRLVKEGYIQVDGLTTSTRAPWITIVDKDDKPPELE